MLQCDNRAVVGHIENFKAIFNARAQRPVQGLLEQVTGGRALADRPCCRVLPHLFQYIVPYIERGSHRNSPFNSSEAGFKLLIPMKCALVEDFIPALRAGSVYWPC